MSSFLLGAIFPIRVGILLSCMLCVVFFTLAFIFLDGVSGVPPLGSISRERVAVQDS